MNGLHVTDEVEKIYSEAKGYYPEMQTRFLPNLRSGKLIYFGVSNPGEGKKPDHFPRYIHIIMQYPKHQMDSIERIAWGSSIRYTFNDPYLLVLDYDPEKIKHFRNLKTVKDTLDLSPIPNFDFLQENRWRGNYVDKATITSLGWTQGPIIDTAYLRSDRGGLPESWKHGSTKGVTIWDNFVAYWLDVW